MQKFEEAVNSRPPYPKEKTGDKEHLVVPWRNIDREIGVSLALSHPPPKP